MIRNAQDLSCIGIHELAWDYNLILEVMETLKDSNYIVLGGDVYRIDDKDGQISSTGDSWYFNKSSSENDVFISNKKAKDYIVSYHNKNGRYFCYSLVCEALSGRDA